jgi:hypothetical protein
MKVLLTVKEDPVSLGGVFVNVSPESEGFWR